MIQASNTILILLTVLLIGCHSPSQERNIDLVYNAHGITVYQKPITSEFPKAKLRLVTEDSEIRIGRNSFDYQVTDYALKSQTLQNERQHLANSHKGQHIHFIVDNKPYQAKYEPIFMATLEEGNHLVLAFLSRSFHESVKREDAFVLKQYNLGSAAPSIDIKKDPLLFYSRPKGVYKKQGGGKILLDFYLVNSPLNPNGNKVKVILDEKATFTLDKWAPYIIEGLKPGEHQIVLELIDNNGTTIAGPFNNSSIRKFRIE